MLKSDTIVLPWLDDEDYYKFIDLSKLDKLKILEDILADFTDCLEKTTNEAHIVDILFRQLNDYINNYQMMKNIETL